MMKTEKFEGEEAFIAEAIGLTEAGFDFVVDAFHASIADAMFPPREDWTRKGGWTNRHVIIATARLGGFLACKHDGMPGWQTIWRGWRRLMWMCEGVNLMGGQKRCG